MLILRPPRDSYGNPDLRLILNTVDQRAASTKKKQLKLKEMGRPQIAQIHICEGGRRKGQEGRSIQ